MRIAVFVALFAATAAAQTGRPRLVAQAGHSGRVLAVAFSPDGRLLLTGSADGTALLWDVATGRELRRFDPDDGPVGEVAFGRLGRKVFTRSARGIVRAWDVTHGVDSFVEWPGTPAEACSRDGKWIVTAGEDSTVRLIEVATGKEIRRFEGLLSEVRSLIYSPDGRWVLARVSDTTACLWEVASGREIRRFEGPLDRITAGTFAPDGRSVLTGNLDGAAYLWDVATGKEIRTLEGHAGAVRSVAFSSDGARALTGGDDRTARIWDVATGGSRRQLRGHTGPVESVAFSPDGKLVLTGSRDGTARLWNATTGGAVRTLEGHTTPILRVAFSPDGEFLLSGCEDGSVHLWDLATGKEIRRFAGHSDRIRSLALTTDNRRLLTGSADGTARLWEVDSGREARRFEGYVGVIVAAGPSPAGPWVVTGSRRGAARLWEAVSGEVLCRLLSFRDGTWAVVDEEGRYDASRGGDVRGLHWVIGTEPIALEQLKQRYFEPALLGKLLGLNRQPLREVQSFEDPALHPDFDLEAPTAENPVLVVRLRDRGGGIGRVLVKINGKELTADARGADADPKARSLTLEVSLAGDPRLKPGVSNTIEVFSYNADGYLSSPRGVVRFVASGRADKASPELWAVVCGTAEYAGDALDLGFASKDAEDITTALEAAAPGLFGDRVHIASLLDPTRAELIAALEEARKARPGDVLVLYLAGHGVSKDDSYYYLTREAESVELADPAMRKTTALSSAELAELVKRIPCEKQVLILDTCSSGRFIEGLKAARQMPSDHMRALDRLKDRTGLHVLAGCAADRPSYEANCYGQGVLTYSLLMGMRGAALRDDRYVDVVRLFQYAADRVPVLAGRIGGIQRPVLASPGGGGSFDIGRMTAESKARVPLRPARPVVLRSSFQEDAAMDDVLDLARSVDERLEELSNEGREAPFVFVGVDARDFPEAYAILGRYRIGEEVVTVTVGIFLARKKTAELTVTGPKDARILAERIVAEVVARLGS